MKFRISIQRSCACGLVVAGGFLVPAILCSRAAAAPGLKLDQAIGLALVQNPELRASAARVDAARGRAHQAPKWSNPELELRAEDWPVSNGRGFSDAKQTVGISQMVPYPGKKSVDKRVSGAGVRLSGAQLEMRRDEIVRDVKIGFFRVLASDRLAEVSKELTAVAEESAATARKRVDAGAAAYQEQLRAEVQLEHARSELADFQREAAVARQAFATLLGQPDLYNANLEGSLPEVPNAALMDADASHVADQHPSSAAAQANLERALLERRRSDLEPYPDVKVGVAGGRIGASEQSIIELAFSVSLPILDQGKGRQDEARAEVSAAEAELAAVRQQLRREAANARQRYRTAALQVGSYRERILPKAGEALRLVQTGFEEGKFSFIDLLDTQRTVAEARLAYQKRLLELVVAQSELESLLLSRTVSFSANNGEDHE